MGPESTRKAIRRGQGKDLSQGPDCCQMTKGARTSVSAVAVAMPPGDNKDNGEAMRDAGGPLEPGSLRTHTLAFSNTRTN